ncbi:hypothetical protein [Pseudochryseolinea flava]|nr:hypothetical protein [Pseudochryseolinea flava]
MKNIMFTILFAVATTVVFAQEKTTPKSEFTVELSTTTVSAKPGETTSVDITLNRSKSYSKSNAKLGLSSGLPAGVTIEFEPAEGVIEKSTAKISLSREVKAGSYTIILNSVIQNKSKGKTLKLVVNDDTNAVTLN